MYDQFLASPRRFNNMTAQRYLRRCFVESNGTIIDWAHSRQQKITPHLPKSASSRLLPDMLDRDISGAVSALEANGYWVSPFRMPQAWVDAVKARMMNLEVSGRQDRSDVQVAECLKPREATYWYDQTDLLGIDEIHQLIRDPVIREVVGRYLRCDPVYDFSVAWWSFPSANGPDPSAAQLYHFDLDRVRWLKIFVYLTDVDELNGPHAFIRGSHKTIGKKLWRDGRYSDQEVFALYDQSDETVFTGPAGTLFIEDTMGFHKGLPVKSGSRLVFESEFSINHFGYPHADTPFDY
ncbi:MAG TPA: phytanoyl-CoA dioxygenase family protein [Elainellaceae cyanobacterium]